MNKGITKKDSLFLYGVAIIFMIFHHLFGEPSRIQYGYFSTLDHIFPFFPLERSLAWFCKLCVAIFAFITGYGMAKSCSITECNPLKKLFRDYVKVIVKGLKFIFKLFLVLSVYVLLLKLLKGETVSFKEYALNVFAYSSSLCGEYWYAVFYIKVLLFIPLLNLIFSKNTGNTFVKLISIILPIVFIVSTFIFCPSKPDIKYSIIILEGFILSRFNIFQLISSKLNKKLELILSVIILIGLIVLRFYFQDSLGYNFTDPFIISPFIYCTLIIFKKIKFIYKPFCFLGKYSTFIWLTHTLICYKLFTKFITISGISTIIFIQTLLVSFVVAVGFTYLEKLFYKLFKFIEMKIIF